MQFEVRLVHAETGRRVVEARAVLAGQVLGSALGEAGDAETAEDRALVRLRQRLDKDLTSAADAGAGSSPGSGGGPGGDRAVAGPSRPAGPPRPAMVRGAAGATAPPSHPAPAAAREPDQGQGGREDAEPAAAEAGSAAPVQHDPPGNAQGTEAARASSASRGSSPSADTAPQPPELPSQMDGSGGLDSSVGEASDVEAWPQGDRSDDPDDWSTELARLELSLRRIGWTREQEGDYLRRAFGHPSRSRITSYSDLQAYLRMLDNLEAGADPLLAGVPLRRRDLMAQSETLLRQLGWDEERARRFSADHLGGRSRQQLNDEQLLQCNMLLEAELIAGSDAGLHR
jgi:hypothetical protein